MAQNDFERGDLEKAKRNFEKAAESCSQGLFNAAKDLLQKGIKACPEHSESHRLLGQVYLQEGELTKAENSVIEALRIDPKNMWALILMGNILNKNPNKVDVAETYFQKVLEYYPDNVFALNNVGGVALQKGEYNKAIDLMERSLKLDGSLLNSFYGLALACSKVGKMQESFDAALNGVKLGKKRPEDGNVHQKLLKLLLDVSAAIADNFDYVVSVKLVAKEIEKDFGVNVDFVQDENQQTLAHLEFADFYGRKNHVVKYRTCGRYAHWMLHELMHLEMMLRAKQAGTLKAIWTNQDKLNLFQTDYQRHFNNLRKQGITGVDEFAKVLFDGMKMQVMNSPLDFFVEQKIYEKTQFRPLQLISLYEMEQGNLNAVKMAAEVDAVPQVIKDTNKMLSVAQSLMFRDLYGFDFLNEYNVSNNMMSNSLKLFDDFRTVFANYSDGDEYGVFERLVQTLGWQKYFDVQKFSACEISQEEESVVENRSSLKVDSTVTLIVSDFMVEAMEYFDALTAEEVKRIAFEIAMVGQGGINPTSEKGYELQNVPGKHFGGYELLAYYYVSWAQSAPEMIGELGLPFGEAYEIALKKYRKRD